MGGGRRTFFGGNFPRRFSPARSYVGSTSGARDDMVIVTASTGQELMLMLVIAQWDTMKTSEKLTFLWLKLKSCNFGGSQLSTICFSKFIRKEGRMICPQLQCVQNPHQITRLIWASPFVFPRLCAEMSWKLAILSGMSSNVAIISGKPDALARAHLEVPSKARQGKAKGEIIIRLAQKYLTLTSVFFQRLFSEYPPSSSSLSIGLFWLNLQ